MSTLIYRRYALLTGVTDGSSAAAGQIGEYVNSVVTVGVGLTSGVAANVTSITLTAGDWDVWGEIWISFGAAGAIGMHGVISTVSATIPVNPASNLSRVTMNVTVALGYEVKAIAPNRQLLTTSTPVYLIAYANFASGSTTAIGSLSARRVR